jgi:hypothetical protein
VNGIGSAGLLIGFAIVSFLFEPESARWEARQNSRVSGGRPYPSEYVYATSRGFFESTPTAGGSDVTRT